MITALISATVINMVYGTSIGSCRDVSVKVCLVFPGHSGIEHPALPGCFENRSAKAKIIGFYQWPPTRATLEHAGLKKVPCPKTPR